MTALRLHLMLVGCYVALSWVATTATSQINAWFPESSRVGSPLVWSSLFGAMAVVSTLLGLFARGRMGYVLGAHLVAGLVAILGLHIPDGPSSRRPAPRTESDDEAEHLRYVASNAARCARLESWSWYEAPRGQVHFSLVVERGWSDPLRVSVADPSVVEDASGFLPAGDPGERVSMELVAPRREPQPFTELNFHFACPGAQLEYSLHQALETVNAAGVRRPLPDPLHDDRVRPLRGYDLVIYADSPASRYLLRPASNADWVEFRDPRWLTAASLEASVARLPPHQIIHLWRGNLRSEADDAPVLAAIVTRLGHVEVQH